MAEMADEISVASQPSRCTPANEPWSGHRESKPFVIRINIEQLGGTCQNVDRLYWTAIFDFHLSAHPQLKTGNVDVTVCAGNSAQSPRNRLPEQCPTGIKRRRAAIWRSSSDPPE